MPQHSLTIINEHTELNELQFMTDMILWITTHHSSTDKRYETEQTQCYVQ